MQALPLSLSDSLASRDLQTQASERLDRNRHLFLLAGVQVVGMDLHLQCRVEGHGYRRAPRRAHLEDQYRPPSAAVARTRIGLQSLIRTSMGNANLVLLALGNDFRHDFSF